MHLFRFKEIRVHENFYSIYCPPILDRVTHLEREQVFAHLDSAAVLEAKILVLYSAHSIMKTFFAVVVEEERVAVATAHGLRQVDPACSQFPACLDSAHRCLVHPLAQQLHAELVQRRIVPQQRVHGTIALQEAN